MVIYDIDYDVNVVFHYNFINFLYKDYLCTLICNPDLVNFYNFDVMFHDFVNKPYLVTHISFTLVNDFLVNFKHFEID